MLITTYLIKGIIIGLIAAIPIGPIGIVCLHRLFNKGGTYGLVSGLGAATGDAIYAFIACFGVTYVSNILLDYQDEIRFFAGIFFVYLGIKTFIVNKSEEESDEAEDNKPLIKDYLATLILTLANPACLVLLGTLFAGFAITKEHGNYILTLVIVIGVFIGSSLWWIILDAFEEIMDKKIKNDKSYSYKIFSIINKGSGMLIIIFGIVALMSIFTR